MKLLNTRQQLHLLLVGTDREENVLLGHLHPGRDQRLEVSLVLVLSETGDLSCRRHLDTQDRIRSGKSTETELRNLDSDVVLGHLDLGVRSDRDVEHDLGGELDSVDVGHLGDKGSGPGGSKVALDHLDLVVLGHELDVVRTGDIEGHTDLLSGHLDSSDGFGVEILRRQDKGGVSRVNTSVLDVLGDVVHDHLSVSGDGIHLNLFGLLNVLGDDDWVVSGDGGSLVEVGSQVVGREDDVHGSTRKDVGRSDEDGVADLVAERLGLVETGELLPQRLVDSDLVQHSRELVSVLGGVDHLGGGTVDLDVLSVKLESDVVGGLTSHREHHTRRSLGVVNVEDGLERDVLKVESIGLVVIGRNRLGVVVDHDRLEAQLSQRSDSSHRTPIELDRRTNSVHTRTKNHDTVVLERDVVLGGVVGGVEVVGERGELGSDRIDLLDERSNAGILSKSSDSELVGTKELGDLSVRESKLLALSDETRRNRRVGEGTADIGHCLNVSASSKKQRRKDPNERSELLHLTQSLQSRQEPLVNLGHLMDLVDGVPSAEGGSDSKESLVGRSSDLLIDIVHVVVLGV